MVESKLVELVVAGSNPVGHPILIFRHLQDKHSRLPQKAKSLSENFERQFNFGLKPALTPAPRLRSGQALSPRRGGNCFRCSQEPRVRIAENLCQGKINCQSNTFQKFQTDSDKLLALGNDLKF